MASQRLIKDVKTALRETVRCAGSHAELYDKAVSANGSAPNGKAQAHMDEWEMYETLTVELGRYLNLAEAGASDSAVKAAGYDPERFRPFR